MSEHSLYSVRFFISENDLSSCSFDFFFNILILFHVCNNFLFSLRMSNVVLTFSFSLGLVFSELLVLTFMIVIFRSLVICFKRGSVKR